MATVDVPAHGYGIRYANGMFRQEISRRLAGRTARNLARPRQSLGVRAPRARLRGRLRRLGRIDHRQGRPARAPRLEAGRSASWPSPTTRRSSAGAATASTRCGCGRRCRSIRSCSTRSTPATTSARCAKATRPMRCRACSIRPTRTRPGRNCGCGRSISSPPPRCRTSCSAISASMAICSRCPTRRRSISTTPIRRSPSPN